MGEKTGISWTDSTFNPWWGCAKVGPGCDHCYAEALDARTQSVSHWGIGAPRRRTSEKNWNEPRRWQKQAEAFIRQLGRKRRVFSASMADIFDNEVDPAWRRDLWALIRDCPDLNWQLCTKRLPLVLDMLPDDWSPERYSHVGLLVTMVNQEEAERDLPRLDRVKREAGLTWCGISWEPALSRINLFGVDGIQNLDWIIGGGESPQVVDGKRLPGRELSDADFEAVMLDCNAMGIPYFHKQMPNDRPIPDKLMVRGFPGALM